MIKTAIIGAESRDAGELLRLLAMHPDVEITGAQARGLEGKPLTTVHHGLIGETTLNFTSSVDYNKLDVMFVCGSEMSSADIGNIRHSRPEMKLIMLHSAPHYKEMIPEMVYGLPEMHRKALVRGATTAVVPEAFASMALVGLFPFAKNLLLTSDINIDIKAPESIIEESDMGEVERQIVLNLSETQQSFRSAINISASPSQSRRSAMMDIEFDCSLSLQQLLDIYEIYDDHRFSFVTTTPVGFSEVAGTNKCIICVMKPTPERVSLRVVADCRLRGGAGEAMHIMNLMCGLHERTGLALKAIDYDAIE